jgi:hypothetical protein
MADEMNQEVSQFALEQERPQKTELEQIQERISQYTIPVTPSSAQTIQSVMEMGLAKGNFKLSDLDALVAVREETAKGLIDYQTQVSNAQRRLAQLQEDETARVVAEREAQQKLINDKLIEERQSRKNAEQEIRLLKAQIEALSGVQGNVTSAPTQGVQTSTPVVSGGDAPNLTGETKPVAEEPKKPSKPSPAFAMARALNPVDTKEDRQTVQDEIIEELGDEDYEEPKPISQDKDFVEKVEETKQSFKEWNDNQKEEVAEREITIDVPEDAKGIEDFYQEVDKVDNDFDLDRAPSKGTVFPVTAGNAPSVTKEIKSYESVEDLQAAVDEKNQQQEEDYEEVTIPSESELKGMTKAEIAKQASALGFESVTTSSTKDKMIENFLSETESFIEDLKESGEFVSASDGEQDDETIRDGGYF